MTRARASEVEQDEAGWQLVLDGGGVQVVYAAHPTGYVPVSVGDLRVYVTASAAGETITRERVLALVHTGTRRVARVRSEDPGNPAADSERDLVLETGGVSPDIGVMTTVIGPVHTLSTRGLFLPDHLVPGATWTWEQRLRSPLATMLVTGAAEVVCEERVTVAAGTFTAMRVRSEISSSVQVEAPAGLAPLEVRQRDDSHWVRGLGLVRYASADGLAKQLRTYSVRGAPLPDDAAPR